MALVLKSNKAYTGSAADLPYIPILDLQAGAAHAWSVARKLRSAYSGSAIRVRRSSDNTESDIGFTGNGLDTATLLSFAGAGNAFVTTVYDQSGSGVNLLQATAGSQPKIVNAGALVTQNSLPSAQFDGADDRLTFSDTAVLQNKSFGFAFAVFNASTSGQVVLSIVGGTGLARATMTTGGSANQIGASARRLDADAATAVNATAANNTLTLSAAKLLYGSGTISVQRNAETAVTASLPGSGATSNTASSAPPAVGSTSTTGSPAQYFGGYLSELIVYNTDISATFAELVDDVVGYYSLG